MIKPITTYDAYFLSNKNLFGIDIQGVKQIEIIDEDGDDVSLLDFFTSFGTLYFSVLEDDSVEVDGETVTESVINFYSQKNDTVTKISALPEKPVLSRSKYEHAEFSISDMEYQGKDYTDVKNIAVVSGVERFLMVDNFVHYQGQGLYFNVSDGRYNDKVVVRKNGLYFWDVTKKAIEFIKNEGVMWK